MKWPFGCLSTQKFILAGEHQKFEGVKKLDIDALAGQAVLPEQQWLCNLLDVEDCAGAWLTVTIEILMVTRSWRCALEGLELDGTTACTPSKWDYTWMGFDCLVIAPVGMFTKFGGRGAKIAARAAENADVLPWIEKIGKARLAQALAGASEESFKHFDDLLKAGKFSDAEFWVAKYITTPEWVVKSRAVKELTKQIDVIIGHAKKAGKPAGKIIEESGAGVAHAKSSFTHAADYADEIGKLRKYYKENAMWDDVVEMDRNIWMYLKDPAMAKYLTDPIEGSLKIHPTGIRTLDLFRVEAVSYTHLTLPTKA